MLQDPSSKFQTHQPPLSTTSHQNHLYLDTTNLPYPQTFYCSTHPHPNPLLKPRHNKTSIANSSNQESISLRPWQGHLQTSNPNLSPRSPFSKAKQKSSSFAPTRQLRYIPEHRAEDIHAARRPGGDSGEELDKFKRRLQPSHRCDFVIAQISS